MSYVSAVNEPVAIFISVFVVYIVCVYLVGSKLSTIQSIAITLVYSVFSLFFIFLVYTFLTGVGTIQADFNNTEFDGNIGLGAIAPLILVLAWLLSIIYMVQVRRERKKEK
ncbi:MAG: hypothetical protein O2971_02380 [Proteobacteria bacterium]|nr:hypothetical protein [Pseudomonadota bacterium]